MCPSIIKKLLLTFIIIQLPALVIGQEPLPDFTNYHFMAKSWSDSALLSQVEYWSNGQIKTEYTRRKDSIRVRKDYYKSGNLLRETEVYQIYQLVTRVIPDLETGEDAIFESMQYSDVRHGSYMEYKDETNPQPIIVGQYQSNLKVGKWKRWEKDYLMIGTFNEEGRLEGQYFEYYLDQEGQKKYLKCEGYFEVKKVSQMTPNSKTGVDTDTSQTVLKSRRAGIWKYYYRNGELKKTIEY